MTAVLRVERLSVRHPRAERDAVRDVSMDVRGGEIVALVGPNGSGKSTLLASLSGALPPRRGRVWLNDRDLHRMGERQRARILARLPQDPQCPEGLTVRDLVSMGRHAHRARWGGPGARDRRAVDEALDALQLQDHRNREMGRLSGGERRRAWIAMILAQGASIVLLDEPTAALDLRFQIETLERIRSLNRDRGVSVVVVVHDVEHAARIADRVVVLRAGRIYQVGAPRECIREETLQDVFGVDASVDVDHGLRVRVHGAADPLRFM